MNPWDNLPNGKRIGEVLEFAWNNPALVGGSQARFGIWGSQWHEVWRMAFDDAWITVRNTELAATWDVLYNTQQELARDAICALLAYDYAGELYDAELDVVGLAAHAEDPAAVLLLPMLKVMKEKP
jgi:hypothetical protein